MNTFYGSLEGTCRVQIQNIIIKNWKLSPSIISRLNSCWQIWVQIVKLHN